MISIKELKDRGKERIRNCYLLALVVCVIIGLFSGGFGSVKLDDSNIGLSKIYNSFNSNDYNFNDSEFNDTEFSNYKLNDYNKMFSDSRKGEPQDFSFLKNIAIILFIVIPIAIVIGSLISIFVGNILFIGQCTFFLNAKEKPQLSDITSNFRDGKYSNSIKIMLIMNLKIFLWSLLFIIPGIIKSFEYAMIPYILSENPDISTTEAFEKSKELMEGYKWFLFTINLSFIGWYILGSLFFGIGSIFVTPWVQATICEFYLNRKTKNYGYSYDSSYDSSYDYKYNENDENESQSESQNQY